MNDYEEQLPGGTPPELTPEQLAQLADEQRALEESLSSMQPEVEQPEVSETAATAASVEAPQQQQTEETGEFGLPAGYYSDLNASATAKVAAVTGVADFIVDALNLIPNVNIPKVPRFENDVNQSIREISSIVIPTMATGGLGSAALGARAAQLGNATRLGRVLNDPLVKHIGTTAFTAGAGAGVDYTVEINQQDDNLAGTLRKTWPRWFGWIPEDLATLDSDSPETKRAKNVTEGAYLGIGTDMLLGLNKLFRNVRGFQQGAPVPKTEKAAAALERMRVAEGDVEDVVETSAAKRADSLDELGSYNVTKADDPDNPIFGYHDLYGYQETGTRSVDDLGIVGASIDTARIANDIDTVYGRIGNSVSEGALKFSLENVENQQAVQKGLADVLTEADEYGYRTATGKEISSEQIQDAGERLAATFYGKNVDELRESLAQYQRLNQTTNVSVLSETAYKGVVGTLNKYMDDFVNMNYMRAQAYVGTSFAGQISDMAQGMRLTEGTPAILRAQEQILDRMEFLMVQKNITAYSDKRFKGMFGFLIGCLSLMQTL